MEIRIDIPDDVWAEFLRAVKERKGETKGFVHEAIIEAIKLYTQVR